MQTGPFLSVAETCRRLGVTRKALRLYEAQGLIKPERTQSEWRVYGPAQIARLHQALALKRFGFPLTAIAEILNGKRADISRLLEVHEKVVASELEALQRAARLITAARGKLARDGALSTDDLIFLTKETLMTQGLTQIYDAIAAKHLSDADRATLEQNGLNSLIQPDDDWPRLHDEARLLMVANDPASLAAMDLARRWMSKVFESTGGDRALTEKVRAVARDLHDEPAFQQASTSSNAMMDFVQKAYGAAIAAGLMPRP